MGFIKKLLGISNSAKVKTQPFKSVTLAQQVWMVENLNVEKFRNGDPISHTITDEEWRKAGEQGKPAWCYYDNDPANGKKYGKLYNWYAVNNSRGLAPEGWHIPGDEDWEKLRNLLGDRFTVGVKIKNKSGWNDNHNGTNESGLSALPGGYRSEDGSFCKVGDRCFWWTSTEGPSGETVGLEDFTTAMSLVVLRQSGPMLYSSVHVSGGLSVRCVRNIE